MGIHNRQRRAAKKRKRVNQRGAGHSDARFASGGWERSDGAARMPGEHELARTFVEGAVVGIITDRTATPNYVRLLTRPGGPVSPATLTTVVNDLLRQAVAAVVRGGWAPSDLAQLCRRRLDERHLPALAALLATEADRHPQERVPAAWRTDLDELGTASPADPRTCEGLELLLNLAATITMLPVIAPVIPPPGTPVEPAYISSGTDARVLARVRALLAKAESTPYAEEAEALSAKAQELITRYTLDRLVQEDASDAAANAVGARRLWIDPPYVLAKALLVHVVAEANRCRSAVSEQLGFCTVVGEAHDLEAVELLATSLLVQANAAMLRSGSRTDRHGRSTTTSFRRSFLLSYATRIGERLRAATETATEETGRSRELVPLLKKRAEQVDAEWNRLFPNAVGKGARISNHEGWAEGRAAADLARLHAAQLQLTEPAS